MFSSGRDVEFSKVMGAIGFINSLDAFKALHNFFWSRHFVLPMGLHLPPSFWDARKWNVPVVCQELMLVLNEREIHFWVVFLPVVIHKHETLRVRRLVDDIKEVFGCIGDTFLSLDLGNKNLFVGGGGSGGNQFDGREFWNSGGVCIGVIE